RTRPQSPKLTMSVIAPIVQKLTRLATAPKTNASAKARPVTRAERRATSGTVRAMISRLSQMSIVPARQPDCATHAELRERPLLWFDGVEHETKNNVRQIEGPV